MVAFSTLSQVDYYKENAWGSVIWKHQVKPKWNLSVETGYRTFDQFIQKRRQDFGRMIVDRKLNDNHSVGLGFAYFESYKNNSSVLNPEFRPFFQYQFTYKKGMSVLGIRYRNEFRYYSATNTDANRNRLQLSYEYTTKLSFLKPKLSVEGFVSNQKIPFVEQRYSVGNTFSFNKALSMYLFYTLQLQSNIKQNNKLVNQHIIGFQIIVKTAKKDEK